MTLHPHDATDKPRTCNRAEIPERYRWKTEDIFDDWAAWEAACGQLEQLIGRYAQLKGTLRGGPEQLLAALQLADDLGQLTYRVYYYPALRHDEDQRDNETNARRQQAQILLAKSAQAGAWFNPELLTLPLETVQAWTHQLEALAIYRFSLEEVYRQQEHVLDDKGEHLLSLASRFRSAPDDTYAALTTADMQFPTVTLSTGEQVTVTYGRYRAILAENRQQQDRAKVFKALYTCYQNNLNTYASLYSAVTERDWFVARARNYPSTLHAALHGDNIPVSVVENLIATTRAGTQPLQRYHRLRKEVLGLDSYRLYDGAIPLARHDKKYRYDQVKDWIIESVAQLGVDYQSLMREAFAGRWIDVYENEGKRSGAYSAPVHGVHPYMLLNYNDTLDDMFTLAHEMGHSMHTILSHRHQPFVYASYTIFVAEVASTFNEALLLDYLLANSTDPAERATLLQHAIDSICGTFYTQVLFADWELRAHRAAEQGEPLTAAKANALYGDLLTQYYGGVVDPDPLYDITWSRIPHFFRSPYYVYQYATCFASSARLRQMMRDGRGSDVIQSYLTLLKAGSCDHPMALLQAAGVDLSDNETVQAVVWQLDGLVDQLERELAQSDTEMNTFPK